MTLVGIEIDTRLVIPAYVFFYGIHFFPIPYYIYILLYEVSTWKTEELAEQNKIINLKIFTLKTGDINIV